MFCVNCGKEIVENSRFCKHCGYNQSEISGENKEKENKVVWTCDFCGNEFDTKKQSDKHELNCANNPKNKIIENNNEEELTIVEKDKLENSNPIELNDLNQDKLIKKIKDTGIFLISVGILKYISALILVLLTIFNSEISSFLSNNYSYTDISLNIVIGTIYLIIGKRISKSVNHETKKYLWSMTIITSILVILNLFNGGKPYLSGFLLFDLIRGLSAIKKINVFDNSIQKYKISGWKWVFVFIGFFLLIAIGVGMGVAKSDTLLPDIKEIAVDKSENNSEIIDDMYRNTKYGFRIKFPEGWKMEVGDGKHIVQKAGKGNASILIMVQQFDLEGAEGIKDITEIFTIDEFIETITQGVKDKFSNVKIIDKGETKIDNMPTYWFDYSGTSEVLGIKVNLTMRTFMFAKNDTMYSIQAATSSDEFKATEPEFMKSAATFVLEN